MRSECLPANKNGLQDSASHVWYDMQIKTLNMQIVFLVCLFFTLCSAQETELSVTERGLGKYLEYSTYTDPGEFEFLYNNLPESIEDICALIKKQLIHPFDIEKFGNAIPRERAYKDRAITTVEQMLKELFARDSSGLVPTRHPQDRLVVACVHHSLLLASILRHQGIPVRLRAGHAKYIGDDSSVRVTHVICEVWDAQRDTWILVDPDRHKINFDRQEFEFACETWYKLRNQSIDKKYYISRYNSVDQAAAHLVWLDLSYVTGAEEPYWNDPPIVTKIAKSINELSNAEMQLLDDIAELLKSPDNNVDDLKNMKQNNPPLNFKKP